MAVGTTCRRETGITPPALRGLWLQRVPMGILLHPPVSSQIPGKAALPGLAAAIPTLRARCLFEGYWLPQGHIRHDPKNNPHYWGACL